MMKSLAPTFFAATIAIAGMTPVASANLLNNGGFEEDLGFDFANPANWNGFFGGPAGTNLAAFNDQIPSAQVFEGEKALFLRIAGNANEAAGPLTPGFDAFTGHVQTVEGLSGGTPYVFSIYAKEFVNDGNGFEFRVEWQDASGVEISRTNVELQDVLTGDWEQYSISETAPAGTARASVVVAVQSFLNDGSFANIQVGVDAASFDVVPEPASAALLALGGLVAIRRR